MDPPIVAKIENWKKSIVSEFFNNVNTKMSDVTIPKSAIFDVEQSENESIQHQPQIIRNVARPICDWRLENDIKDDSQVLGCEYNANDSDEKLVNEGNIHSEDINVSKEGSSVTNQLDYTSEDVRYSNDLSAEFRNTEDVKYCVDISQDVVRSGRNCVSVVLVWDRVNFYMETGGKRGRGGMLIERFFCSVTNMIKSMSTVSLYDEDKSTVGNQARRDYVFCNEMEAYIFNRELIKHGGPKSCLPPKKVVVRTFLNSEEDLGYGSEPLLTEKEILHLHIHNQAEHLFRHFITCFPVKDNKTVSVKFNSLSDVNLFLFNKVKDPSKRTLGVLRKDVGQLTLVPDKLGYYRLVTSVKVIPSSYKSKFKMIARPVKEEGDDVIKRYTNMTQLLFKSNLDMMTFFTCKDVKDFTELCFDESLIQETEYHKLKVLLRFNETQVKNIYEEVVKLEKRINEQSKIIVKKEKTFEDLKKLIVLKEIKGKSTEDSYSNILPYAPWLSLKQVLSLKFKDETKDSINYNSCLASFLNSPALLEILKGTEGEIRFLFKDRQEFVKLYRKCCVLKSEPAQRAMLTPSVLFNDFCLLIYLEESSILKFSMKQVEEELKISGARIDVWKYGFKARYHDSLGFFRGLTNVNLNKFHRLVIQDDCISFSGGSEDRPTFKGLPCLYERTFLSCLGDDSFAVTSLLKDPLVLRVWLDWEGDLVLTAAQSTETNKLLREHCRIRQETGLFAISSMNSYSGPPGYYLLCPPSTDIRDFFKITDTCKMEGEGRIVFNSKLDLVRCLIDPDLRKLYPDIQLHKDNICCTGVE